MKKNKVLAAIGAAAASAVIMGGGVNAAPVTITTDANGVVTNTDTIQVSNVTKSGDAFKACKIVDVKYDSTSNVISYEFTSAFNAVKSSLSSEFQSITIADYMGNDYASGTASGSAVTGNTKIDKLAGELASNSTFVSNCTNMTTGSTSPYAATANVAWGGYLIIPQGNSSEMTDAYGAMIANLTAQTDGSGYNVDTTHATVSAKKSAAGSVQKTTNNTDGSSDNSFAINETFRYVVTAVYPTYPSNATNKKFIVTDTPESGITLDDVASIVAGGTALTIDGNNIKNGANTVGTISNSNGTITFTFNDVSALGGNNNNIVITYNAHLNSNATLGDATGANSVNENSVTIKTPQNPYDVNSSWETSGPVTTTVYTYGIKITKIKENDSAVLLPGAEFNLCLVADTNCSNPLNGNTPITTNASGEATYVSVGNGEYYLKEIKAPAGYRLAANTSVTITVNSGAQNLDNGYFEYTIEDPESIFNLPFTGGRGVVVYAILGVGIVGIASVFYYRKKKQQA
ncbi:SpaH/EbpB family LPXTG-anchored major pilin [Candidatus Saccharibacteria bacterium]|nr:SpaH/EbpB family LPXTG-anchored major pilin [Candidatus Saccharibacteria bacterium]